MTLLLRTHEVEGLLDLTGAMQVLERVYREQAAGEVNATAPLRLMERGEFDLLLAALPPQTAWDFV